MARCLPFSNVFLKARKVRLHASRLISYFMFDYLARKLEELEAIMYETLHDYFDFCQQEGVY